MGFLLIVLPICAILFFLALWIHQEFDDLEAVKVVSFIVFICSIVGLMFSIIGLLFIGTDILYKDVNIREEQSSRSILIRMLNEDYNSENLEKSLNFNKKMAGCKFRQNTVLWKYFGTDGACVDTIEIPTGKFIPTQQIRILTDSVGN